MIVGLGSDVIEINRVEQACRRYGNAFLRRILSEEEHSVAGTMQGSRQFEFAAGRFAVKEAMAKASGIGLGRLGMSLVTVSTTGTGLRVTFTEETHPLGADDLSWHVSITHTKELAFAVAVLERE